MNDEVTNQSPWPMARNVFSNLELFEEEYRVRTAISAHIDISLESYDLVGDVSYTVSIDDLIQRAKTLLTEETGSQTAGDATTRHYDGTADQ